jgi:nucleoside-diphosphate-sugar epimerase
LFLTEKSILVAGACGTIGKELVRQLLEDYHVTELVALDNNESERFFLENRFSKHPQASFFLADVRDRDNLCKKMKAVEKGFNDWKHITTGSDLDNIRNSSYYKEVVKKHSFLVYRF